MTPDLDAIRARAAAATEGPWTYGGQGWVFASALVPDDGRSRGMRDLLADIHTSDDDALFVAHARSDIPALLAEIERLRDDRDRWKQAYEMADPLLTDRDRLAATVDRVRELVDDGMQHVYVEQDDEYGVLLYDLRAAIEGTGS